MSHIDIDTDSNHLVAHYDYRQLILKSVHYFKDFPFEVQNDKDFLLDCLVLPSFVNQLKYISIEQKNNKELFQRLIPLNYLSLFYSSNELQQDKELILLAFQSACNEEQYTSYFWNLIDSSITNKYQNNIEQLEKDIQIEKLNFELQTQLPHTSGNQKKLKL